MWCIDVRRLTDISAIGATTQHIPQRHIVSPASRMGTRKLSATPTCNRSAYYQRPPEEVWVFWNQLLGSSSWNSWKGSGAGRIHHLQPIRHHSISYCASESCFFRKISASWDQATLRYHFYSRICVPSSNTELYGTEWWCSLHRAPVGRSVSSS